jgi:predicted MPP superfamily phosphohydrolase
MRIRVPARRITLRSVLAVGLALAVWAFVIEPGRLVRHDYDVMPSGWPSTLDGFRIAVLTDLHTGSPRNGRSALRRVVAETNAARPDLVVILGDLVIHGVLFGRFVPPEDVTEELRGLRAPYGVVSVLGNHDWWLDGERVRRALDHAGLRPLENDAVRLDVRGQSLWVAGLADLWTRPVDVGRALQRVPPMEPVIVLSHNPDVFPWIPAHVSLTLAGHTHGGQVALPLLGRPVVPSRYGQRFAQGVVREDGRTLFVGSGLGTSILPVRFRVPPEIAVVTLRR